MLGSNTKGFEYNWQTYPRNSTARTGIQEETGRDVTRSAHFIPVSADADFFQFLFEDGLATLA